MSNRYRFGPYILDVAEGSLTRNGYRVKIQDLPFRLLLMLAERSGEIISKEEMQRHLWPKDTFVEFDNSLGVAVRKIRDALNDDSESPRYLETVPRRGYRFLAPVTVLEHLHPEVAVSRLEPQAPSELTVPIAATAQAYPVSSLPVAHHPSNSWLRYLVMAGVVVFLTGGAIYTFRAASPPITSEAQSGKLASIPLRRSIAVLGFRNLPANPEDNWLSPAFAEMLNTELASDGAVHLVSGEDITRIKRELPIGDEDSLGKATLARLKSNPGADIVILGSFTPMLGANEKRIRLDVRIQDTATGETVVERSFTGKQADLFELVAEAGRGIRQSLGIEAESGEVSAQARAALPSNEQAIRFYVDGKQRLWAFDSSLARDLLKKAIAADPAFPLSHAALSEAWQRLGYQLKARSEAERARALSNQLGPEERMQIDAQFYSAEANRQKAIEAYKALFTRFPDDLNYGLSLADEQRHVSADDALRTLTALRRLPPSASKDPRIDLLESRVWMTNDVGRAQAAAQRGLEGARARGSPLLMARSYAILCELGKGNLTAEELVKDCDNARESARAAGEADGVARASNDLAGLYFLQGHLEQAEEMYRESLDIFRKTGDIEGTSAVENNLGAIALLEGNVSDASRSFADSIPGYRERDDKDGVALALNNLGDTARMSGDWKTALSEYAAAESVAQEIDDKSALGYIFTGMGSVQTEQADFQAAGSSFAEALNLRRQTGEKQFLAETEIQRARLLMEESKPAEAASLLENCKQQFHVQQQSDDELEAGINLINALVDQSRLADANREVEDSSRLVSSTMNVDLRSRMDIAEARVEAGAGRLDTARTHLNNAVHQAQLQHFLGTEFEARLWLATIKKQSGPGDGERNSLLALERLAHDRGFEAIAIKAKKMIEVKR